jgi:hypothetical protein
VFGRQRLFPAEHGGGFGVPVEKFADTAFGAEQMPTFGYGCAVFMQSDIVDFQRQAGRRARSWPGSRPCCQEHLALRRADPNLAKLGKKFVLQAARSAIWPR